MKSTRLFVGGLDGSIDNQLLTSKLSKYGTVSEIELKEKKDAEGNVTFRFAYVNIESAPYQIEECVSQLNGALWSGSRLRVEVAKESFLDRLKRERAKTQEQQQEQQAQLPLQAESPRKSQKLTNSNFHEFFHHDHKQQILQVETESKKKRKNNLQESNTLEAHANVSLLYNEDIKSPKKKQKANKKNEAEEEMMASFKTFSSVWADSDEDEDSQHHKSLDMSEIKNRQQVHPRFSREDESNSSVEDSEDDSDGNNFSEERKSQLPVQDKRQNWGIPLGAPKHGTSESDPHYKTMTRYDPTRPEHQHFRILPSSQSKEVEPQSESHQEPEDVKSCGFSFLKVFDQLQKNESASSVPANWDNPSIIKEPVREPQVDRIEHTNHIKEKNPIPEAPPCLPLQKRHSFFLNMKDYRIQEGLDWMMQNDQYHLIPEYQAVESDLYNVIKTRSTRAKREARKERIDNENKRKSSKHKDTEISVTEDQYYDYAWRRAVQLDEARKTRGRGHTGAPHQGRQDGYSQNQEKDQGRDSSYGSKFGGANNFSRSRGRGDYLSGRGRGNDETRGRGRRGSHSWGEDRGDVEAWGRGRANSNSWSRRRGDFLNKDHGQSKEEESDCLTRG